VYLSSENQRRLKPIIFAVWKSPKHVVEETATEARKKDGICRAAVEGLAPKTLVEIDSRAPFVCLSLNTDDLAKARSRSDILEKADNELWAAMLPKGCVVNR